MNRFVKGLMRDNLRNSTSEIYFREVHVRDG